MRIKKGLARAIEMAQLISVLCPWDGAWFHKVGWRGKGWKREVAGVVGLGRVEHGRRLVGVGYVGWVVVTTTSTATTGTTANTTTRRGLMGVGGVGWAAFFVLLGHVYEMRLAGVGGVEWVALFVLVYEGNEIVRNYRLNAQRDGPQKSGGHH